MYIYPNTVELTFGKCYQRKKAQAKEKEFLDRVDRRRGDIPVTFSIDVAGYIYVNTYIYIYLYVYMGS